MRSRPAAARTILLFHIISARPSKQTLMVRTFLKVYMELGSYFLFLQEQIKDIIIFGFATRARRGGRVKESKSWGWRSCACPLRGSPASLVREEGEVG